MKNLLAIEASTALCSLALSWQGAVFQRDSDEPRAHTAFMFDFVDALLNESGAKIEQLDAIVFSAGPGSFTGIRLAASVAKSLAYAAQKPVIGVSSLAAMAQCYYAQHPNAASCLVVSDARMDEFYVAEYQLDAQGHIVAIQEDALLTPAQLAAFSHQSLTLVNDGSDLVSQCEALAHLQHFPVRASAKELVVLANQSLLREAVNKDSALTVQVNYLRGKSGWKNVEQQKRNPVQGA